MASYYFQDKLNERNSKLAEMANEAHERRMMSRRNFIESNPGAVSPQERAAVLQWNRDQGLTARERALQEHERGMLGDKIKGEINVAHEKRLGMENQGVGAANINAQAGITNTEREWAARKGIADTQSQNALELEKERQRGELAITAQKGKDALITEQERQAGALDLETQRGKSAAELQKEALASQERQVNTQAGSAERIAQVQAGKKIQMTPAQESDKAIELMKRSNGKLAYEQALAQVRAGANEGETEAWPGYTAERTAELKKRGYTLVNGKPVKNS